MFQYLCDTDHESWNSGFSNLTAKNKPLIITVKKIFIYTTFPANVVKIKKFFWFSIFFFYLFEHITPFNLSAPFSILSFLCWRASYVCLSVSISTEYSTSSSRQFRVTCVVFSCITSFYFAVKVIDTQSHLSAKKLKRREIAHRFMCRFEGVISFFV